MNKGLNGFHEALRGQVTDVQVTRQEENGAIAQTVEALFQHLHVLLREARLTDVRRQAKLERVDLPRCGRLKKLVILKEVVCDGSKMKLNDMVSQIGQSSLSSSPRCRHHLTHYLTTLITLHNLVSDSGS